MTLLTRDAILKVDDRKTEDVAVPEWGGTVRLQGLTGAERDKLEASVIQQRGNKTSANLVNYRAKLVAMSAVDEGGHKIFSESDIRALAEKSSAALDRLASVASKLSGMSPEDVEDLTEGFGNAQSEDSISD